MSREVTERSGSHPTGAPAGDTRAAHLMRFYPRLGKRLVDLALAVPGAVLLMLPAAVVALLIRVVDGSPVLFSQLRVGRHGRLFRLFKFRTMRPSGREGTTVTVAGDRRVTGLGALLRRLKLDELPQLVNVIRGEMSFVGPRPDVPGYLDSLSGGDAVLLDLRPGITGPATLVFRNEETLLAREADPEQFNSQVLFPRKVRLNLRYQEEMSLAGDIGWVLLTLAPRRVLHSFLASRGWVYVGEPRCDAGG